MEVTATERRLAAIFAADVIGCSRLIEKNEAGTLATIRKLRAQRSDPLLARHESRIVALMGDAAIGVIFVFNETSPLSTLLGEGSCLHLGPLH